MVERVTKLAKFIMNTRVKHSCLLMYGFDAVSLEVSLQRAPLAPRGLDYSLQRLTKSAHLL